MFTKSQPVYRQEGTLGHTQGQVNGMSLPACNIKAGMHQAEEQQKRQQKSALNEWECQAATGFSPELISEQQHRQRHV